MDRLVHLVESQGWLDRPSYRLEHVLALGFNLLDDAGRPARSLLHGTRLGHPLHPLLTDLPIGAWTVAEVLDGAALFGRRRRGLRSAARLNVGVGLAGAGAAAVTGLIDWQYTDGDARRVGLVHGTLNGVVVSLYGASLAQRMRGRHGRGRVLSGVGYLVLVASTYLGGVLTFRHRIGVDHADRQLRPRDFVAVLPAGELTTGQPRGIEADGVRVVLVRDGDSVAALGEACSHQGGPMSEGVRSGDELICPWHGSRYDIHTGRPVTGPATAPLACFDARIRDGQIEVRRRPPVSRAAPGAALAQPQGSADARD